MTRLNPIEALWKAIWHSFCTKAGRNKPGYVIEHLSAEHREALKELKSDDALNMRADILLP